MIRVWPKYPNFWCRWISHKKVRIPDSENSLNMAYCKRCLCLVKWKNAYPCAIETTGYSATVKLDLTE